MRQSVFHSEQQLKEVHHHMFRERAFLGSLLLRLTGENVPSSASVEDIVQSFDVLLGEIEVLKAKLNAFTPSGNEADSPLVKSLQARVDQLTKEKVEAEASAEAADIQIAREVAAKVAHLGIVDIPAQSAQTKTSQTFQQQLEQAKQSAK